MVVNRLKVHPLSKFWVSDVINLHPYTKGDGGRVRLYAHNEPSKDGSLDAFPSVVLEFLDAKSRTVGSVVAMYPEVFDGKWHHVAASVVGRCRLTPPSG